MVPRPPASFYSRQVVLRQNDAAPPALDALIGALGGVGGLFGAAKLALSL